MSRIDAMSLPDERLCSRQIGNGTDLVSASYRGVDPSETVGDVVRAPRSSLSTSMRVVVTEREQADFTLFVHTVEPRLRRALVALRGPHLGRDGTAEALAWAWEHWEQVRQMENPAGYLYRVGQSRTRQRRRALLPADNRSADPHVEPRLGPALAGLSERQRTAVVLVHGCSWSYQEVAEALGVSKSSVGTHVARALQRLRQQLDVTTQTPEVVPDD